MVVNLGSFLLNTKSVRIVFSWGFILEASGQSGFRTLQGPCQSLIGAQRASHWWPLIYSTYMVCSFAMRHSDLMLSGGSCVFFRTELNKREGVSIFIFRIYTQGKCNCITFFFNLSCFLFVKHFLECFCLCLLKAFWIALYCLVLKKMFLTLPNVLMLMKGNIFCNNLVQDRIRNNLISIVTKWREGGKIEEAVAKKCEDVIQTG